MGGKKRPPANHPVIDLFGGPDRPPEPPPQPPKPERVKPPPPDRETFSLFEDQ